MNTTLFLRLLRGHWKVLAGGVALLAFVVLLALYRGEKRRSAKLQTQLTASVEARKQDRASYINAQAAAKAQNEAQVARIETEQEKVSVEQKNNYERDLARLRAGGVRQDLAAVVSPSRSAKAGSVSAPACQPDAENVCVARARVLQGAESELAKNALIDWINAQGEVAR